MIIARLFVDMPLVIIFTLFKIYNQFCVKTRHNRNTTNHLENKMRKLLQQRAKLFAPAKYPNHRNIESCCICLEAYKGNEKVVELNCN